MRFGNVLDVGTLNSGSLEGVDVLGIGADTLPLIHEPTLIRKHLNVPAPTPDCFDRDDLVVPALVVPSRRST